ncbi:MAG: VacJ family lipoprotein [Proteobacteria bacterium]|nr:VacJ family lipoprotein [Pseudomonadota bacterium]
MKHIVLLCVLLLSACATAPESDDPFDKQDPIKPFNQAVFDFNLGADRYVIKPVAEVYHHVPEKGRQGIGNFLTNLSEPSNVVNGMLQLNPDIAFTAFWRCMLNTTFGLGGFHDFAGENGLKNKETDFGETLGRYGLADGAYLVLPLAGPSTVRDTAGVAVDWFLDPVGWFMTTPETIAQLSADAISTRDADAAVINQFYYESLEPYSATRAAYLQHQAFQ